MPTIADHHRLAAEHHERAAHHHREAIRLHGEGDAHGATHHAYSAAGHGHHAHHHEVEAAKLMASDHAGQHAQPEAEVETIIAESLVVEAHENTEHKADAHEDAAPDETVHHAEA